MTTERCEFLCFPVKANQLFRPANGTEGDIFTHQFCERCVKDNFDTGGDPCPILMNSLLYEENQEGYPKEWHYDAEGYPFCEAFEERR